MFLSLLSLIGATITPGLCMLWSKLVVTALLPAGPMYVCSLIPFLFPACSPPKPHSCLPRRGGSFLLLCCDGHSVFCTLRGLGGKPRPFQILGCERMAKYWHPSRDDCRIQDADVRVDAEGNEGENMNTAVFHAIFLVSIWLLALFRN